MRREEAVLLFKALAGWSFSAYPVGEWQQALLNRHPTSSEFQQTAHGGD